MARISHQQLIAGIELEPFASNCPLEPPRSCQERRRGVEFQMSDGWNMGSWEGQLRVFMSLRPVKARWHVSLQAIVLARHVDPTFIVIHIISSNRTGRRLLWS